MKRIIAIASLFAMVLTFAGCSVEDKVFTHEEMSITLNENFTEKEPKDRAASFHSHDTIVFIRREAFSTMVGLENYTLEQYAKLVAYSNSEKNAEQIELDGFTCVRYSYSDSQTNDELTYLIFLYKSDNAFWMVQFVCKTDDYAEHEAYFIERAKTVTFSSN